MLLLLNADEDEEDALRILLLVPETVIRSLKAAFPIGFDELNAKEEEEHFERVLLLLLLLLLLRNNNGASLVLVSSILKVVFETVDVVGDVVNIVA